MDKSAWAIFALAPIVGCPVPHRVGLKSNQILFLNIANIWALKTSLPLVLSCFGNPYVAVKSFAWARHKLVRHKSMLIMKQRVSFSVGPTQEYPHYFTLIIVWFELINVHGSQTVLPCEFVVCRTYNPTPGEWWYKICVISIHCYFVKMENAGQILTEVDGL